MALLSKLAMAVTRSVLSPHDKRTGGGAAVDGDVGVVGSELGAFAGRRQ